jgi:hypothetical protein
VDIRKAALLGSRRRFRAVMMISFGAASLQQNGSATSRRCGKILKRPNSKLTAASDTGSTGRECKADLSRRIQIFSRGIPCSEPTYKG